MKKVLVGFFMLMFLLSGCSKPTNEEIFYKVQQKINKIDSYRCLAHIKINGNKGTNEFKAKHVFKKPNKYIVEILNPQESKGFITVYDGNKAWVYHPRIDESVLLRDINNSVDEHLFVGYFFRNMVTTEKIKIGSKKIDKEDFLVVTAVIPGNNKYRAYEQLWINKKTLFPYKLVILNKSKEVNVEILYEEFKYNIDINKNKFNINVDKEVLKKL